MCLSIAMASDLVLHTCGCCASAHVDAGGGWRQMVQVDPVTCTVFLNAATVPRVVPLPHSRGGGDSFEVGWVALRAPHWQVQSQTH